MEDFWKSFYVPDESEIVELGESVGQVVERDRCDFLKIVIFEQGVLDQPVCRPTVRFRQIKIVLGVIQHLNEEVLSCFYFSISVRVVYTYSSSFLDRGETILRALFNYPFLFFRVA